MFEMEEIVLATLKFHLAAPTIKTFLRRYLKAASATSEVTSLANVCNFYFRISNIISSSGELTLQEYSFTKYLPSMVAISAVCLASHSLGFPNWVVKLITFI